MPMEKEQLEEFMAKIPAMPVEKKLKLFLKVRETKAAAARAFKLDELQFNQILECCENHMLAEADKLGVSGFKTPIATTYTAETTKISIADQSAFFDFVLDQKDLDFFEKRVSSTHVEEYMKNNPTLPPPPGLSLFRERAMRVRKAGDK